MPPKEEPKKTIAADAPPIDDSIPKDTEKSLSDFF